jgi:hypothetical protein
MPMKWDIPPTPLPFWLDEHAELRADPAPMTKAEFVLKCVDEIHRALPDAGPLQRFQVAANAIVETGWGKHGKGNNLGGWKINKRTAGTGVAWFRARGNKAEGATLDDYKGGDPPWCDINFDEGWIKIEAQTTKVRQRRVVYPLPMAMDWLKLAKKKKASLPLSLKQRTKDRKKLRAVLGWAEWKQDVTRHTAASMWLAHSGSVATVATALGHSESVLRKNYMALVTKSEAEKFWGLRPNQIAPQLAPSSAVKTR